MQLVSRTLPIDHNIILAGDTHKGTIAHHRKGWEKLLKRIEGEENTYAAFGGDLVEAILWDDPRFSTEVHDAKITVYDLIEEIKAELFPIREKVLFVLTGNHEMKLLKYGNLIKNLCQGSEVLRNLTKGSDRGLNVPYGGWSTKLHVYTKNGTKRKSCYKLFYTHGRLSVGSAADDPIRRRANMALKIKRKLYPLAGDCAIMATAHCHQLQVVNPMHELFMNDDGKEILANYTHAMQSGNYIPPNLRYYIATGSFLKTFVTDAITYSEQAMYSPNDLGYAEIVVRNSEIVDVKEVFIGTA